VAIFTTNVNAENQTLINHKCVCGAPNRHFCQTRVCALNGKYSFLNVKIKESQRVQVPYSLGQRLEELASRKLV
jgi:hypothetical protein